MPGKRKYGGTTMLLYIRSIDDARKAYLSSPFARLPWFEGHQDHNLIMFIYEHATPFHSLKRLVRAYLLACGQNPEAYGL